ncbi:hypothetical protein [Sulfoacidibacillus ferrooxidans]|uniref:Uncharacterized protein n=1 Tax=Sulfoacidibacillus ferrooxidans TaxID=2005001 RepID=A0A9X1V9Y5_9BACL|nr:hypothetical protein [Sulfoacidibacillus ferrooxidans]MCI0182863.1 hypothetical protein [Sulfoacidibacillus ferrooxidans]
MGMTGVRQQCLGCQGGWVQFRTRYGLHQGMVQQVRSNSVLMKVPAQYAPSLATFEVSDEAKLDMALAQWGGGYPGYGAGYGGGYGAPGAGWWGGGYWWWWLAFGAIFWLSFLFW